MLHEGGVVFDTDCFSQPMPKYSQRPHTVAYGMYIANSVKTAK